MTRKVDVCSVSDVAPGSMQLVTVDDTGILLVNLEGSIHAMQATCSHEEAELDAGELAGDQLMCTLHWSSFDVRTGEVIDPPAEQPLVTFPVSVDGDRVSLEVPDGPISINLDG